MSTISMFYGIVIRMYYDDHKPPHFYAFFGEYEAIFNFKGEKIQGEMPNSKIKLITAWTLIHIEDLMANWELAKESEKLYNINPLN